MARWRSPSIIPYKRKSSLWRDLPGAVGNVAEYTVASGERFSLVGTIAASAGDCYKNWWDQSAEFRLIPNVLPTRQCLPLNAPCSFFNCPLPSSRMLKSPPASFSTPVKRISWEDGQGQRPSCTCSRGMLSAKRCWLFSSNERRTTLHERRTWR